jgi:hypothetical protein
MPFLILRIPAIVGIFALSLMSCTHAESRDNETVVLFHRSADNFHNAMAAVEDYYTTHNHWPLSPEELGTANGENGHLLDMRRYQNLVLHVLANGGLHMQWNGDGVDFDITLPAPLTLPSASTSAIRIKLRAVQDSGHFKLTH